MSGVFNKSLITNLLALVVIGAGYISPVYADLLKSIGFFALSGAITNWLAIHMLFEKVPLLYGSGVIPSRFEEFKVSIKELIMQQFFTVENVEHFIEREEQEGSRVLNLEPLLNAVDYDHIYEGLVAAIMESSFGNMIQMLGGKEALLPVKESFTKKMRNSLVYVVESDSFTSALQTGLDAHQIGEDIIQKIELLVDKRLDELTPEMVKKIVQKIIRTHLGWLVVWGGVFGGLLGAMFSFV